MPLEAGLWAALGAAAMKALEVGVSAWRSARGNRVAADGQVVTSAIALVEEQARVLKAAAEEREALREDLRRTDETVDAMRAEIDALRDRRDALADEVERLRGQLERTRRDLSQEISDSQRTRLRKEQ